MKDERNWCPMRLSGLMRCEGPDPALKAENERLREFAQAMAEAAYKGQMLCDGCRFSHGCYNGGKKEHEGRGCQWWLWARELGIEVSHG